MKINCDIGERGCDNATDLELMNYVDIANIACGGHAGTEQSIDLFRRLAKEKDVLVSAHLSYPDRENFGRVSMDINKNDLLESLDRQYALINDVKILKFHGALYNDLNGQESLAKQVFPWILKQGFKTIICAADSALVDLCRKNDIEVWTEVFAERAYIYKNDRLSLMPRNEEGAVLHDLREALAQSEKLKKSKITAKNDAGLWAEYDIEAQTICIHSDAVIALDLAKGLKS